MQKAAIRVILNNKYTSYQNGLKILNIQSLEKRRDQLCLKFAKINLQNEKVQQLFPKNKSKINTRKRKKFKENDVFTERYKKSAIPHKQKLLNKDSEEKRSFLKT